MAFGIAALRATVVELIGHLRIETHAGFEKIGRRLTDVERTLAVMATRDELNQAIGDLTNQLQGLGSQVSQLGTDVQAALDRLTAKINSGGDFTAEADAIRNVGGTLNTLGQQLQQTDAAAVAAGQDQLPTPQPVPAPAPGPAPEPAPGGKHRKG